MKKLPEGAILGALSLSFICALATVLFTWAGISKNSYQNNVSMAHQYVNIIERSLTFRIPGASRNITSQRRLSHLKSELELEWIGIYSKDGKLLIADGNAPGNIEKELCTSLISSNLPVVKGPDAYKHLSNEKVIIGTGLPHIRTPRVFQRLLSLSSGLFVLIAILFYSYYIHGKYQKSAHAILAEGRIKNERLIQWQRLASTIAHEIKNPLASIRTFAELLERRLKGKDAEEEYAQTIIGEVDRLDRIVTDSLAFARPLRLVFADNDLSSIVEEAVDSASVQLQGRTLEKNIEKTPPIRCDAERIRGVLYNILINAAAATKDGDQINVSLKFMNDQAFIKIADTGSGIDAETASRAFEPFFTTKTRGTGLGLALSRQVILGHGGDISIKPSQDKGTIVQIQIPREAVNFISENNSIGDGDAIYG